MTAADLKPGMKVTTSWSYTDTNGKVETVTMNHIITSITEKRVNLISDNTYTSSTGRSSNKSYLSVKEFIRQVNDGEKVIS